jgi:hypothetical protein
LLQAIEENNMSSGGVKQVGPSSTVSAVHSAEIDSIDKELAVLDAKRAELLNALGQAYVNASGKQQATFKIVEYFPDPPPGGTVDKTCHNRTVYIFDVDGSVTVCHEDCTLLLSYCAGPF